MIRNLIEDATSAVWDALPTLTSEVEIPIYLIHHGTGPEDYEIICDFDRFVAENQTGLLTRPALKVWSGRHDINTHTFARNLRHAFSEQFEAVRAERLAPKEGRFLPRLSFWDLTTGALSLGTSLLGTLLLWIAMDTGRSTMAEIRSTVARLIGLRSDREKLEAEITEKQKVIDAALERIAITLHRDLWRYAYRHGSPGPMTGMDHAAWPLPEFVRARTGGFL